jgi:hypothetical protein
VKIQDVEQLLDFLRQDPALRRRVLEALLSEDFLLLPGKVDRLEETLQRFMEATERRFQDLDRRLEQFIEATESRFQDLDRRLEQFIEATERRFQDLDRRLEQFIEATERRFQDLDRRLEQFIEATERRFQEVDRRFDILEKRLELLERRVERLEGWVLEDRYDRQAYAYFGRRLRRIRVVSKAELEDLVGDRVEPGDLEELFLADVVIRGRPKETPERELYLVLEVSSTIDVEDVEGAARRAEVVRRAGLACIPVVGGMQAAPRALDQARQRKVAVAIDGRLTGWDEALAAA